VHTINQFIWGYQTHFRASVRFLANEVLKLIGVGEIAEVLLVGVRRPEHENRHAVCIEPEDGPWPHSLFEGVDQDIEAAIPVHELQSMVYGDEPSMQDKPENIRRLVVQEEIQRRIGSFDSKNGTTSFCGAVYPVRDHYVCTIIQVPAELFDRFPPIPFEATTDFDPRELSFIKNCLWAVLDEARHSLVFSEPGRNLSQPMRSAQEVVARAASRFMYSVSWLLGRFEGLDLFRAFNQIAALKYEGADVNSRLVLVDRDAVDPPKYLLRFAEPVRLSQSRWARKLLNLVTRDTALVGDNIGLYGISADPTALSTSSRKSFIVEFPGNRQWVLSYQSRSLLRVEAGDAQIPQEPISFERFLDLVQRIFADSADADSKELWQVLLAMQQQSKGHMVVIAADAAQESERLAHQGMRIEPTRLTSELLGQASRIDGAILIDPQGLCYAIGVILDGAASDDCTPSRGARYNSAVRYVGPESSGRMAIVISDDATLDIIPMLRPRLAASKIEGALATLASATLENYHQPRLFLDRNRFYLNAEQCERANELLRRLEALPLKVGEIRLHTNPFSPDPRMNDTYLS
jgi:hypothetical protein